MDASNLTPALGKLRRAEPVAARAYRELRNALLRQSFAPGQRLVEAELAAQLGISRTPVREALGRLVAERMVDLLPSGGLAARDVRAELEDIYGLRQVLEGYAARLAASRLTNEELASLETLCAQMREDLALEQLERLAESNDAFHLAIATGSRSDRLVAMIQGYRAYFLSAGALSLYDHAALTRLQEQHETILAALGARAAARAEQLVRAHFQDAMNVILSTPEA